jgi:cytochrome c oxidase subunit 1
MYATSLVVILGTPVVAITLVMIFAERGLGFGIFDPTLGGDPVLFQHLFWFYSHPAVYIMILPGLGVISELISCFSRRRVYGYTFVAFSSLAIAVIGFFVWGHHMFVSSQSVYAGLIFSFLTFFVAIPTAIKILNWIMTMFKGSIDPLRRPCCMPSVSWALFTIGGLTGLFLSTMATDIHLHRYVFRGGPFPLRHGGRRRDGLPGRASFLVAQDDRPHVSRGPGPSLPPSSSFIGFNLTFFPQFQLGYHGMPRRYHTYVEEFQVLHIMSTAGASVLGAGLYDHGQLSGLVFVQRQESHFQSLATPGGWNGKPRRRRPPRIS